MKKWGVSNWITVDFFLIICYCINRKFFETMKHMEVINGHQTNISRGHAGV